MELSKNEKKLIEKFNFFKKKKVVNVKEKIKEISVEEKLFVSIFLISFVVGMFSNVVISMIFGAYLVGIIYLVKGSILFKPMKEVPSKIPLAYFSVVLLLLILPDINININIDIDIDKSSNNMNLHEMILTAPLSGVY